MKRRTVPIIIFCSSLREKSMVFVVGQWLIWERSVRPEAGTNGIGKWN